ncbi:MAG: hypothetical protein PF570_05935, partial [Candidatus Cloacimonetes bacterium]|nr:hypothetical protein [Candidatus Cloacimonadota bacterium]
FNIVIHQFYLSGQCNQLASSFIFTRLSLKIHRLDIKINDRNNTTFDMDKIITVPYIKILNEYNAEVTLTMFSDSSGIFSKKIYIEWPCRILKTRIEILIKYDKKNESSIIYNNAVNPHPQLYSLFLDTYFF